MGQILIKFAIFVVYIANKNASVNLAPTLAYPN